MQTNIAGASGKVNCFEADLILTNHTRSTLVVAEISASLILLAGAALLIRTLMALHTVDAGFDADNVHRDVAQRTPLCEDGRRSSTDSSR